MTQSRTQHRRRRVLLDTSGYFALADRRDDHHEEAQAILTTLASVRWQGFTTNYVVAETHALLLNRLNRQIALRFLQQLDRGGTTIVRVNHRDEQRARAIIVRYDDKDFSLTDATSFAVMERLRIGVAFSFDRDFAQYGFQLLT